MGGYSAVRPWPIRPRWRCSSTARLEGAEPGHVAEPQQVAAMRQLDAVRRADQPAILSPVQAAMVPDASPPPSTPRGPSVVV
jgi:hypothetical protein